MGNNTPEIRFDGFSGEWEYRKLGEVISIKSGWSPSDFNTINANGKLYIKVDDLNYSTRIQTNSSMQVCEHPKYQKMKKGSTIFPKRGAAIMTNKVRILGYDSYMDTNMMALEPTKINSEFLYTFVAKTGLYKIADTSTIPQINNKHIEPYKITIPNSEEQSKIGYFFKQLDDTIALQQQELDTLKQTKQGFLQKMFPKEGETVPEVRFEGFSGEWEERKLGEVSSIYDGTHQTPKYTNQGIMFLSVENIRTLYSKKYISQEDFEKEFKIRPTKNDVLMTRIGDVGTANVVQRDEPVAYYVSLALIKSNELDSYFLQNSIHSPFVQNEIWRRTLHIAFPKKINKIEISKILLKYPNLEEQSKIGSFFKQLDDTITLHQRELEVLKETKQAFLQKMFV